MNPSHERQRDPAVTSAIMSHVRSKDSKAELALRRVLHGRGVRYRLHVQSLPGTPDLAIRKFKLAVFVDGDMWHGHEHTRRGLVALEDMYPSNTEFWVKKIRANVARDRAVDAALSSAGWLVVRVWESDVLDDPGAVADTVQQAIAGAKARARGQGPEATIQ